MKKRTEAVWIHGVVAGLIGYVSVAVIFAVIDWVNGQSPFHTAALLGSGLYYGLRDPSLLRITVPPIAAFNATHLALFLMFGILASWGFAVGHRRPPVQYGLFSLLVLVGFHVYVATALFAWKMLGTSAWWQVGLSGVVAMIAMGYYLFERHPVLAREMKDLPWDRAVETRDLKKVAPVAGRRNVLTTQDVDALARLPATISTDDIQRLLISHRELQGEVDNLRAALTAADHWLDDGGQP